MKSSTNPPILGLSHAIKVMEARTYSGDDYIITDATHLEKYIVRLLCTVLNPNDTLFIAGGIRSQHVYDAIIYHNNYRASFNKLLSVTNTEPSVIVVAGLQEFLFMNFYLAHQELNSLLTASQMKTMILFFNTKPPRSNELKAEVKDIIRNTPDLEKELLVRCYNYRNSLIDHGCEWAVNLIMNNKADYIARFIASMPSIILRKLARGTNMSFQDSFCVVSADLPFDFAKLSQRVLGDQLILNSKENQHALLATESEYHVFPARAHDPIVFCKPADGQAQNSSKRSDKFIHLEEGANNVNGLHYFSVNNQSISFMCEEKNQSEYKPSLKVDEKIHKDFLIKEKLKNHIDDEAKELQPVRYKFPGLSNSFLLPSLAFVSLQQQRNRQIEQSALLLSSSSPSPSPSSSLSSHSQSLFHSAVTKPKKTVRFKEDKKRRHGKITSIKDKENCERHKKMIKRR